MGMGAEAEPDNPPHPGRVLVGRISELERLKAEIPIWKREHYGDGEAAWREEEPLVSSHPSPTP